jgi:hypothetical protein
VCIGAHLFLSVKNAGGAAGTVVWSLVADGAAGFLSAFLMAVWWWVAETVGLLRICAGGSD